MEIKDYLPLLPDILVGALLLIGLIIGAKRGLLRGLIGAGVIVLALFGAAWCASNLTEPVSQWITPLLEKRIAAESPLAGLNIHLPDFLSGWFSGVQEAGHDFILERVIELVRPIIYAAIYLITFLLLLLILRLLGKLLRIVEKLPIIKTCNGFGGAILGLISGAVIVSVALWAMGRFGWLPQEMIESSYFAKYFTAGMWIHDTL